MMPNYAHINAQSAAWFAFACLVIIGVSIWLDMRSEEAEKKRRGGSPAEPPKFKPKLPTHRGDKYEL